MSLVAYNGITLPFPFTTSFAQEAVYESSSTDWYLNRFIIQVQCVLNSNFVAELLPALMVNNAPISSNPADIKNAIYTKLMTPRQSLSFKVNGVEMIPGAIVSGKTVDAQNGPQPQRCILNQLTNKSFILTWSCIANYWINNSAGLNAASPVVTNAVGGTILYNRWEEIQDIDNRQFTTLTRTGRAVIRSDNADGVTVDQVRSAMIPTQPPAGFLRRSSRYVVDKSGLGIDYAVVDVEVFKKPPAPAYEATGAYHEKAAGVMGAMRHGQVNIRLRGAKDTPQHILIERAVTLASAKLHVRGHALGKKGFDIITDAQLNVNLFDNEIEFFMTAMMGSTQELIGGNAIAAFKNPVALTYTPLSDEFPDYVPDYGNSHGTANVFLQAAAYYDPNLTNTIVRDTTRQLNVGKQPGAK